MLKKTIRKFIKKSRIDAVNAKKHFNLNPQKTTLVVLGGSLGAKTISQLIAEKLDWFLSLDIQIIWQCGSLYYNQYKELSCKEVNISAFVNEMDQLYACADIIISRAGAATLAELSCVAKPAILIPSPNVAENHQFHNAMALANQNAAFKNSVKNRMRPLLPDDEAFENIFASMSLDIDCKNQENLPVVDNSLTSGINGVLVKVFIKFSFWKFLSRLIQLRISEVNMNMFLKFQNEEKHYF